MDKKIEINGIVYLTTKTLGHGSTGTVFEAKNEITKEIVAIKITDKDLIHKNNGYIFQNVIDIMKVLECEYSCKLLKHFQDNKYYYLIMKKYDSDLKLLLQEKFKNGMPIHLIKKCLLQLNIVFKKMNDSQIIHRDINPSNILIEYVNGNENNFNFILSDFSLSEYMNEESKFTNFETLHYMAPEISVSGIYNSNADLWSLGATILRMLNKLEYLYKEIKPNLNNDLLEDLLSKMLMTDPNKRINWNTYFQHNFFKN
jgi:glycogen synthase kinase 3 beta